MPLRHRSFPLACAVLAVAATLVGVLLSGGSAPAAPGPGGAKRLPPAALARARTAARPSPLYVRVDQLAVAAGRPWIARVLSASPVGRAPFTVVDATGRVVARGRASRETGAWSARLRHAAVLDVPALPAGTYVVRVRGRGSPPVHAGDVPSLLAPALADAVRFFRGQRDGPDVDPSILGRRPSHLADEHARSYAQPAYRHDVLTGSLRPLRGPLVDVSGGWFDAGDDIKFLETASFADTLLLWTDRDAGAAFGSARADLDREARFGAEWLLKMVGTGTGAIRYQVGLGNGNARVVGAHDASWGLPERDDARHARTGSRTYYLEYRPAFVAAGPRAPLSPNLAGRTAAALALAAQVFMRSDPAFAARALDAAEPVYARTRTRRVGRLLTTSPYDYYPEDEWRDDMELGGAELARATAQAGQRALSARYVTTAARWADRYMSSPNDGDDTLNLYDVSALAHLELGRMLRRRGAPQNTDTTVGTLAADLRDQLAQAQRAARRDPFGLGSPVHDGDDVPHAFGLALEAFAYDALSRSHRYAAFATTQRDWALGDNPWGVSFVVGAGTTFPHCLHSPIANLNGSLDGRPPLMLGATVAGPQPSGELANLSLADGFRRCPANRADRYAQFSGHGVRYEDAVVASPTNEPTDDASALALAALGAWAAGER